MNKLRVSGFDHDYRIEDLKCVLEMVRTFEECIQGGFRVRSWSRREIKCDMAIQWGIMRIIGLLGIFRLI